MEPAPATASQLQIYNHALTTDMTGRNLPSRTAASHWMFVKRLQIDKCRPPRCIADFNEALRQLEHFGYYILDPQTTLCRLAPLLPVEDARAMILLVRALR